jgi:hypothetical protein
LSLFSSVKDGLWCGAEEQGALCSFRMAIQREVLEGNLLCDVFLMGPKDMEGLVQMCMEFLQHFMAHTPPKPRDDDLMCTHCSVCLEHTTPKSGLFVL